jgi:hypothetical protein
MSVVENNIFFYKSTSKKEGLEDPSVDGRIISRWIFRKWDWGTWTGLIWLSTGTGSGHL